jgi:hypothetical protein
MKIATAERVIDMQTHSYHSDESSIDSSCDGDADDGSFIATTDCVDIDI